MRKIFLGLILFCFSLASYSQKPGYIRNDTAYYSCDIYKQNELKSALICIVKENNPTRDVSYTPDQLIAYGFNNTDYFTYKIVLGKDTVKRFLEAIVLGDSPVYYLADKSGNHFYIQNDKKELVELVKDNDRYKVQLAEYYDAPAGIIPRINYGFSRNGIIQTVKFIKGSSLEIVSVGPETEVPVQKVLSIKEKKRMRIKRPVLSLTVQSGFTSQQLPLDLNLDFPATWDEFSGSSITYSMSADIPLMKYWPLTFHQEICYNKFVNDYRKGSDPPDYQLIQDFSVISLPAMVRYTFGQRKFTAFINAGFQLDIALNKDNVGCLILDRTSDNTGYYVATVEYMSYSTFQPGIAAGFGVGYKVSKTLSVNSEFRYSRISNVLPDKSGAESQSAFKAGITYHIFKAEKKP